MVRDFESKMKLSFFVFWFSDKVTISKTEYLLCFVIDVFGYITVLDSREFAPRHIKKENMLLFVVLVIMQMKKEKKTWGRKNKKNLIILEVCLRIFC